MDAVAPPLKHLELTCHRIRCQCGLESVIVHPRPWYRRQAVLEVELPCPACSRSLLPAPIPMGATAKVFPLQTLPMGLAAKISAELLAEVTELQDTPAEELPLTPDFWHSPHAPSPAYLDWLAAQPVPVVTDNGRRIENVVATLVLILVVGVCLFW